MKGYKTERINYNYRRVVRFLRYWVLAVLGIAVLTLILNMVFLLAAAFVYVDTDANYIYGGSVMEALTPTQNGYVLDREMEEELAEKDQWAMLLDENGRVIWSVRKPEELEDAYSRSDIARMSKWYLKGYPVQMRVWDDRIMVVGMQKETMWKYTMEYTISWMDFVKRTILAFFYQFGMDCSFCLYFYKTVYEKKRAGTYRVDRRHFPRYPHAPCCGDGIF